MGPTGPTAAVIMVMQWRWLHARPLVLATGQLSQRSATPYFITLATVPAPDLSGLTYPSL